MRGLNKIAGLGAILLGLAGCRQSLSVPEQIRVQGVSCEPSVHVTFPAPLFQDIDGDGKNDIVYAIMVKEDYPRWKTSVFLTDESYEIYFRRNLGGENFAKPKFLYRTIDEPSGVAVITDFKEVPSGAVDDGWVKVRDSLWYKSDKPILK